MEDSIPEPLILNSLHDMVFRSMSVLAGKQLELFTTLKDSPLSADQIAASIGVGTTKLRPLLYALVVVGLLTENDGLFANAAEADHYLVRGRPNYWEYCHEFWSDIWSSALHIGESIRSGKPHAKHDYENMPEDELEEFISSMHSLESGTWLARNYDFSSCRRVLDAGGGSGGLAIGLSKDLPHLQVTIADLPSVIMIAQRFVERAGATERVRTVGVDLVRQPLVGSFDAAFTMHFLQTLSLEEAHQALLNIKEALEPGSTIYIWESPLDDFRLTPEEQVLWGPILIAIYEGGQKRTVQEYRDLLTEAGFEDFEFDANRIITARKQSNA